MALILKRHAIESVQRAATAAGFEHANVFEYEAWSSYLEVAGMELGTELNKGTWYVLASRGEVVGRRRTLAELAEFINSRARLRRAA